MKIIVFNRSINQGGIDDVGVEISKFLARKYEVYLVVLFSKGESIPRVRIKRIDVPPAKNYFKKGFNFFIRFFRFRSILKEINPDIVIAEGNMSDFFVGFDLFLGSSYKAIFTVHNIFSLDLKGLRGAVEKLLFRIIKNKPKKWVSVSKAVAGDFEKNFGEKSIVIYNPIKELTIERKNFNEKFIFAVGRLSFQKDFATLINAFARVEKQSTGLKLYIAGSGGQKELLKGLIDKLNLVDKVILLGQIENISPYLKNCQIFVSSSRYEGMPMAILQALGFGKAIVATKVAGITEAVGDSALLSAPGDEKKLAENILEVLKNENLKVNLEKKAKERSRSFLLDEVGKSWLSLINEL